MHEKASHVGQHGNSQGSRSEMGRVTGGGPCGAGLMIELREVCSTQHKNLRWVTGDNYDNLPLYSLTQQRLSASTIPARLE